ncbi:MAG: hypothetical protein ABIP74_02540 [Candidatus Saccharimonas sp.]
MGDHPRCYFAHHVTDYGTERETDAIAVIEQAGFEVDNPNLPEHNEGYKAEGMNYFLGRVAMCNALALQRFETGEIGAGVGKEVNEAVRLGIPVYEVIVDALNLIDGNTITDSILSVDETRAHIRTLRAARES